MIVFLFHKKRSQITGTKSVRGEALVQFLCTVSMSDLGPRKCNFYRQNAPVCERRVNLLVYSLSLHRHSYIGFILAFASSIHNKQQTHSKRSFWISKRDGRGWEEGSYSWCGEGVAAARRSWPCRPHSPLQNGTFWRASDARWGSRKGYREKSFILTNCHFT